MTAVRLTMAQALVRFLSQQHIERDGASRPFFGGCFGIFGHGNVAGVGQALQAHPELRYLPARNEQAMVHAAAAYAKMHNRLGALACTTSIGPGATNMVTAAAGATINRLPVLLLPGDVFAGRAADPVLQQLESPSTRDISVNDCFRPVSRYWDRIWRPEQLPSALIDAMRVLTSPADAGAVTLCLPQDVQVEAFDYPASMFERRVWRVPRPGPEPELVSAIVQKLRSSRRPLIVAGGGVLYSEGAGALATFCARTGVPVGETQAGRGALRWDHPQSLGAIGVTGSLAANRVAAGADLVIGVGTRYSDFTTASQTAFRDPDVGFININVAPMDAYKQGGLPVLADARAAIEAIDAATADYHVDDKYAAQTSELRAAWEAEVDQVFARRVGPPISQAEVIELVNQACDEEDVVVCAAGSLPGDLHKLWRPEDPKSYHLEYGYSCMGYEIAGGLGVKMAAPERRVWVMVGDGSYLMMAQELATAVQEGYDLNVVLLDNHGYASIGGLSESLGSAGFGTESRMRDEQGQLGGAHLPVDFAANARSLGAHAIAASSREALAAALSAARDQAGVTVIVIETQREDRVPGYETWWDVPVAEVSDNPEVQAARARWVEDRKKQRFAH